MKRVLSLVLAMGLLAGCAGGGGEKTGGKDTAMGRYVEQKVATMDGVRRTMGMRVDAEGALIFYVQTETDGVRGLDKCVLPAGGGELERTDQAWAKEFLSVQDLSEAADGTAYALVNGTAGTPYVVRLNGGAPETFSIPDLEAGAEEEGGMDGGFVISGGGGVSVATSGGGRFLSGIRALEGGDLLGIIGGEGVFRYRGSDGQRLAEYPSGGYKLPTAVRGDSLITLSADGKEAILFDLEGTNQTSTISYGNMDYTTLLGMDADGVFLGDSTGIYRQTAGGSVWERLVDGDFTSLTMPSFSLMGLVSDEQGGFYALLAGDETLDLMHYVYDPDIPTLPDTELTIFGLQNNNTVRQAIGEFQRKNPNVRVNFQVMLDEDSSATADDVIRALNTELLSGKGPDLLLLDGLPVGSYMEKGVLVDLTELVDRLSAEGLMNNLMHAYEREGRIYGVPTRFTVPVMVGEQTTVEQVASLSALAGLTEAGQGGEPPFLYPSPRLFDEGGMLMDWYDACVGSWTGTDGSVDEAALADYFAQMLRIQAAQRDNTPETGDGMASMVVTISGGNSTGAEALDMGAMKLREGAALFHVQTLSGSYGLENLFNSLNGEGDAMFSVSFKGEAEGAAASPNGGEAPVFGLKTLFGGTSYTPVGGVGVVSGGTQQELALEFLEMLLSPTVQDNYLFDGYPVNAASLDRLVAEAAEEAEGDMGFRALCDRLDTPILVDQVVKEAVEDQVKGLTDGTITPQEAAANVAEKTKLYLAE